MSIQILRSNIILPAVTADPGAYALVAMGVVAAGTTHAPITAILIIFELTNDYKIILPLVIARDVAPTDVATVTPSDNIFLALHMMSSKGISQLPVVSSDNRADLQFFLRMYDFYS